MAANPIACLQDIEDIALKTLPRNALDYYRSGADQMVTLRDNRTSFQSIEEVAEAAPRATKWFQLYIYKDRKVTANLVHRAQRSGFKAIVLTVDAPYFGRRLADVRNRFKLPPHLRMANFVGLGEAETQANKSEKGSGKSGSGINDYVTSLFDQSLTWNDITWLRSITDLPIIVKGVLHPEDARLAIQYGASAIMVSNHGARQLDGVQASIDALPDIVDEVNRVDPSIEVYIDGGVRQGTDVLKALALGAKLVTIGRPVLWGLALNGQAGVELTLELLKKELDLAMALSGITDVQDVNRNLVLRSSAL